MSNPIADRLRLHRIRSKKDSAAFGELYDLYIERIYRFVVFKVADEDDAKEISSDVFMKAWEYLTAGKPVTNLTGLLYTMARSAVIDHYRKKKPEVVSLDLVPELPDVKQLGLGAAATSELGEVMGVIKTLKGEYAEVLMLRHVEGLSTGEIAVTIGKTTGNVRVLLHRATEALKEKFSN